MPRLNRKVELVLNEGAADRNLKRNNAILSKNEHSNDKLAKDKRLNNEKLNPALSMKLVIAKVQTPLGQDYQPLLRSSEKISSLKVMMDRAIEASGQFSELKKNKNNNLAFLAQNSSLKDTKEPQNRVIQMEELSNTIKKKGMALKIITRPETLLNSHNIILKSEEGKKKFEGLKERIEGLKKDIGNPLKNSHFLYVKHLKS